MSILEQVIEDISISKRKAIFEAYDYDALKKRKMALTPAEHEIVMKANAVWHMGNHNGKPSSAIWKSKDSKGKVVYGCNTHRAGAVEKTLQAAIDAFFDYVKDSG